MCNEDSMKMLHCIINNCLVGFFSVCFAFMPLLTLDWIGLTGRTSPSPLVWLCFPVVCLALCTYALLVFGRYESILYLALTHTVLVSRPLQRRNNLCIFFFLVYFLKWMFDLWRVLSHYDSSLAQCCSWEVLWFISFFCLNFYCRCFVGIEPVL